MMMRLLSLLLIIPSIFLQTALPSEQPRTPYIAFPQSLTEGTTSYSLGVSLTLVPRAIAEEEIRQIPMLDLKVRYGLPLNFSFYSHLSTVYITNIATAGLWWSHSWSNVVLAFSDEFSFWFGVADMTGFDTKAIGLVNRPGVNCGIDIDSYKISLKSEALITLSQHTYFGSTSFGRFKPEFAGLAFSLTVEQPLWKETYASFGLRTNYAKPNYQVWLAFSVQDRWMVFPELQFAILF